MKNKLQINPEPQLSDLTNVAKVTAPLLKQLLGNNGIIFLELLKSWPEIVGEELSDYCLPQSFNFKKNERTNGCLNINVLSGAFAMEIQQKQKFIIEKINTFFGYPALSCIKICQNGNPDDFLSNKKNIDKVKKKVVSANEESYITELIKDINNDELRQSLENIGRAIFSRKSDQE